MRRVRATAGGVEQGGAAAWPEVKEAAGEALADGPEKAGRGLGVLAFDAESASGVGEAPGGLQAADVRLRRGREGAGGAGGAVPAVRCRRRGGSG
jgi:hypothetical protein